MKGLVVREAGKTRGERKRLGVERGERVREARGGESQAMF